MNIENKIEIISLTNLLSKISVLLPILLLILLPILIPKLLLILIPKLLMLLPLRVW